MAIIKFNNRKKSTGNRGINKLYRAIKYITDREKTSTDLVGGMGVNEENALYKMCTVKNYYNKNGGREYIHFVVSVKGKCDLDILYNVANTIASIHEEYQTLFAIHTNTDNYHIHFILNTVSVVDGHKFTQSKSEMKSLKYKINTIISHSGAEMDFVEEEDLYSYWDDNVDECFNEDENLIEPMIFYDSELKSTVDDFCNEEEYDDIQEF